MDKDLTLLYEVEVKTYGNPETSLGHMQLAIARGIYHWGPKEFRIRAKHIGEATISVDPWMRFNPFGDDMGNHGNLDALEVAE